MKVLKKLLFGLLALIAILAIVSFFLPSPDMVERSTEIDAPADVIYSQVNELKNWEKWSPWAKDDPTMKVNYGDKTEGVGGNYTWTSENSASGKMEITTSEAAKSIQTAVDFGSMGRGTGHWKFEEANGKTKVSWGMQSLPAEGFIGGIIGRYFLAFSDMDKMVGPDFEKGLANIKKVCENMNDGVKSIDMLGSKYWTVRGEVAMTDIPSFFMENYPKIMGKMAKAGQEMTGMPSAFYYDWDETGGKTDMAAAISYTPRVDMGEAKKVNIGPGEANLYANVITYDYFGQYDAAAAAHEALAKWATDNDKKLIMPVLEEYLNDPTTVKDPSEIHTRISYRFE